MDSDRRKRFYDSMNRPIVQMIAKGGTILKMKSLFIFPPGWNPCSPYLALPIIKAYLHDVHSIDIDIRDQNVEFFDYIFTKDYLERCYKKGCPESAPQKVKNSIKMFSHCINEIESAKAIMRSPRYNDEEQRKHVDTVISNAFYIINNTNPGMKISFNSMELKYSRNGSKSVYNACYDADANPYIEFYQNNIIPAIIEEKYECIGVSIAGHTQLISALTLCRMIREQCPCVKHISLGGNYITRAAEKICDSGLFNNFFDSIALYDGEISCTELLKTLDAEQPLETAHNLILFKNGVPTRTPFLKNAIINSCTPNFDGFPLNKYFSSSLILPIYTSRSCYNKCAFCTIPNATTGNYRVIPINQVVENIRILNTKYGAKYFSIVDETFDIKRMDNFARGLLDANLGIYWYCETRLTDGFSPERCALLFDSGCRQIQFGIESYNQRVLDKMLKNVKIDHIDVAIEECLAAGISVHMFFFTGFPTETYEEALRTYRYTSKKVSDSQLMYNVISSRGYGTFGLEAGSGVWLNREEYGITPIENSIDEDLKLNYDYLVTSGLTQEESERLVRSQRLRDGILEQKDDDFELPWMDFVPEVHMVIKASLRQNDNKYGTKAMLSNYTLYKLAQSHLAMIPPEVTITDTKDAVILYNNHINRAAAFPKAMLRKKLPSNPFCLSDIFDFDIGANLSVISELEHFGLIDILSHTAENIIYESVSQYNVKKSSNIVSYFNADLQEWVVFNRITRNTVTVNELSYKILELFTEVSNVNQIYQLLKDNSIHLPKDRFIELISHYIKHDILYALV